MVSRVAQLHIQILSVAFAAGAIGGTHARNGHIQSPKDKSWSHTNLHFAGLVNFLIAPLFGALHITTALGVHIAPGLNKVSTLFSGPIA